MVQRKHPSRGKGKKMVWRITEAAPLGEFVDADAPVVRLPKDREDTSQGGWVMSSFELRHGTDISESPDTVPDDLFDELFPPLPDTPKPSDKQ